MNYSIQATPRARKIIHVKILEWFQDKAKGKVLDIPTGHGAMSRNLIDLDFDVYSCDIEPNHLTDKGLKFSQGDMNNVLPYKDNEFDYICCLEGIEHLENPWNAFRELTRILKRGGILVLTTPNYNNIERRLNFGVKGFFTRPISKEEFIDKSKKGLGEYHINPMGYTMLKFSMEAAGLEVTGFSSIGKKPRQLLLMPLVWMIRLYTSLWPKRAKKKYWVKETTSSEILAGGHTLVMYAVKKL